MQSKEKTTVDARPFHEIWATLTIGERAFFKDKVKHDLRLSDTAIWKWVNRKSQPMFIHQRTIVNILKTMGYNTYTYTLFPED